MLVGDNCCPAGFQVCVANHCKGSCTYYVITDRGEGSLQMITVLHKGGSSQMITLLHRGGPANDYGIT